MPVDPMEDETPQSAVLQMMRGYRISQAIFAATKFGIAELLKDGPRSLSTLSEACGVPEDALFRLLRALASVGMFARNGDGAWMQTQRSACLVRGTPGSLWSSSIVHADVLAIAWESLQASLLSDGPIFADRFGAEFFPYLGAHPEAGGAFQEMMETSNIISNPAVAAAYDFGAFSSVVDIGGGNGSLLIAILQANLAVRGMLFDRPEVLDQARTRLGSAGLLDRVEIEAGDFFAAVPSGQDAYVMRWILHDWGDDEALRILRNVRRAITPGGRLLIVEQVIADEGDDASSKQLFMDLQMLILLGGRERTEREFRDLFAAGGFALMRTIPTDSPFGILEGIPA